MIVVGHRGAFYEETENTLKSFDLAIGLGVERLEFDIHLSSDQKPVVFHDTRTGRLLDKDLVLAESTLQSLKELRFKNGESIPTLEELLSLCKGRCELNLEVKGHDPKTARIAFETVTQHGWDDVIIYSCFEEAPLREIRRLSHRARLAFLTEQDYDETPQLLEAHALKMRELDIEIFHPMTEIYTPAVQEFSHKRKWTVVPFAATRGEELRDKISLWNRLKGQNVNGLCTNFPREMLAWRKQKP